MYFHYIATYVHTYVRNYVAIWYTRVNETYMTALHVIL